MTDAPLTTAASNDHFQIIVGGIVAVLLVLIPLMFKTFQTSGKVNRIRDQVENDHSTNFREEADERHHETSSRGERMEDKIDTALEIVAAVDRRQGRMYDLLAGRIDNLEDTINPQREDSPWKPSPRKPRHSSPSSEPR